MTIKKEAKKKNNSNDHLYGKWMMPLHKNIRFKHFPCQRKISLFAYTWRKCYACVAWIVSDFTITTTTTANRCHSIAQHCWGCVFVFFGLRLAFSVTVNRDNIVYTKLCAFGLWLSLVLRLTNAEDALFATQDRALVLGAIFHIEWCFPSVRILIPRNYGADFNLKSSAIDLKFIFCSSMPAKNDSIFFFFFLCTDISTNTSVIIWAILLMILHFTLEEVDKTRGFWLRTMDRKAMANMRNQIDGNTMKKEFTFTVRW